MAEIVVNLNEIALSLAGRPILTAVSWELQDQQRIGLVGPNGAGKSTLLKLITDELKPDAGTIFRQSGLTCGRLQQEPSLPDGKTVLQEAMTAVPQIAQLEAKLAELETQMGDPAVYGDPDALDKVMLRHQKVLDEYEQHDGASYVSRLKETLTRLGFTADKWETPTELLSGGQKKLIMLAKLVVQGPRNLLLLDEPDNHLDLEAKRKLEKVVHS